jgi:hypothetical protein
MMTIIFNNDEDRIHQGIALQARHRQGAATLSIN